MYFNEHDPNAAQWIRELFPDAVVDARDIQEVTGADFAGHRRVHFFAGIAGWEYALRLAGVPDDFPVTTGSCPCQPFSVAGKGKGVDDERHLWPEFFRLIKESGPVLVFGEQVGKRAGREWLAGVQADLESAGYTFGAANLPAAGVGAPHIRERLYWGAAWMGSPIHARLEGLGASLRERPVDRGGREQVAEAGRAGAERLSVPDSAGLYGQEVHLRPRESRQAVPDTARGGGPDWVGHSSGHDERRDPVPELHGEREQARGPGGDSAERLGEPCEPRGRWDAGARGFWSDYDVAHFTDGKARRVEPSSFPLVNGLPRGVGYSGDPRSPEYVHSTAEARVMRLKGYGNAIVPELAAVFIRCFLGAVCDMLNADG